MLEFWTGVSILKKLPSSKLKIVTNGDFLNTENFFDFINGGVDIFIFLNIQNY